MSRGLFMVNHDPLQQIGRASRDFSVAERRQIEVAADFWGSQLWILDDNVLSKVIHHSQNQKNKWLV